MCSAIAPGYGVRRLTIGANPKRGPAAEPGARRHFPVGRHNHVEMSNGENLRLEDLLRHAGWLNKLARQLARDDVADDVTQQTWLAALASPPDPARAPRPWLARVLQNFVRQRARADSRRARHEQAVAVDDAHGEPAETLYERIALQRFIAERVMELGEPYRRVVLLRYYEDRPAAEIARLTGAPASTIRSQLGEALRRLRVAMDERPGGSRWRGIVAAGATRSTALRAGGLILLAKGKRAIVGFVVGAAAISAAIRWSARTDQNSEAHSVLRQRKAMHSTSSHALARLRAPRPPVFTQQAARPVERGPTIFDQLVSRKGDLTPIAAFYEEHRDPVWAPKMEEHLRSRLSPYELATLGLQRLNLAVTSVDCRDSACKLDIEWDANFVAEAKRTGFFGPNEPPVRFMNNKAGPLSASTNRLFREEDSNGHARESFVLLFPGSHREPEKWSEYVATWPDVVAKAKAGIQAAGRE
jgi:RNA polymerase sigma factor (sigma-70 family)